MNSMHKKNINTFSDSLTNNLADKLTGFIDRNRAVIILISVIIVMMTGYGLSKLSFSNDFRVYFSDENPQLIAFNEMESQFGAGDNIIFYVEPDNQQIFTKNTLRLIKQLTDQAWKLPHTERVSSIHNYTHSSVDGDNLNFEPLYDLDELTTPLTEASLTTLQEKALNIPDIVGQLIDSEGKAAIIAVSLNLPKDESNSMQASIEVITAARALIEKQSEQYTNVDIILLGTAYNNVFFKESVEEQLNTLVALSNIVVLLLLWLLLRRIVWMLMAFSIILFSNICTLGVFGWMSGTITPVSGFVPSVVMTLAVADSVHLLYSFFLQYDQHNSRFSALKNAMRVNIVPLFLTSATTIIGMLCLNLSDSPPYQNLGNLIAVGILFAWLFTLFFLPALILSLPEKTSIPKPIFTKLTTGISRWVIQRHRSVFITALTIVTVLSFGLFQNQVNEQPHQYFDETVEARQHYDRVSEAGFGLQNIFFLLDSGSDNGIYQPEFLSDVDQFVTWLNQHPDVDHVTSVTTSMKRLNQLMHEDDPTYYTITDSSTTLAQYFLVYEMSLPLGLNLDNMISFDRSTLLVRADLGRIDSQAIIDIDNHANQWIRLHTPHIQSSSATGLPIIFSYIAQRNMESLILGSLLALILISAILVLSLKSFKYGLISLIPNLLPAAAAFGLWGHFVGQVDLALSVVMCMSLGIVVDDTVHFLSKYRYGRISLNLNATEAVKYTFEAVGGAMLITTVVLCIGFLVLIFSSFVPTAHTGLLLSLTLLTALILDFCLLPAALILWDRDR